MYLSPAFTVRSEKDLKFLKSINGSTGFSLFWIDIVRPILQEMKANCVLEIGADHGEHTQLLWEYCSSADADLIVVEPFVSQSLETLVRESKRIRLFPQKSHSALSEIDLPVDAVMLEGDLNYYTVYNDLVAIRTLAERVKLPLPVVFVKNTSWPYARRDMYYDPDSIPESSRHPYTRSGMTPWDAGMKLGLINHPFPNAEQEGGLKNGVLTAVEDFIKESASPLKFFSLPVNHGMGIVFAADSAIDRFVNSNFAMPSALRHLLETWELARLNQIINDIQQLQHDLSGNSLRSIIRRTLYRLLRLCTPRL